MRIAESVHNTSQSPATRNSTSQTEREMLYDDRASSSDTLLNSEDAKSMNAAEKRVLDKVAEALARLGRVKRVGLGLKDKDEFVKVWTKQRR